MKESNCVLFGNCGKCPLIGGVRWIECPVIGGSTASVNYLVCYVCKLI